MSLLFSGIAVLGLGVLAATVFRYPETTILLPVLAALGVLANAWRREQREGREAYLLSVSVLVLAAIAIFLIVLPYANGKGHKGKSDPKAGEKPSATPKKHRK